MSQDLHTHTCFSDGKNTPEEMVKAAIEKGLDVIGISDHSYTFFDKSYCIPKEMICTYRKAIAALRNLYAEEIEVRCGIEQDYYSAESTQGYDYVIGSVHYLKLGEEYVPVDESADMLLDAAKRYFDGDIYCVVEEYFRTVADVVRKTGCSLIGHFDVITVFQERKRIFDENHPRYRAAWQQAVDELLKTGVPFEINTGAVSRGYRTEPYPSAEIQAYIRSYGGKLVPSSDAHQTANIAFGFDKL